MIPLKTFEMVAIGWLLSHTTGLVINIMALYSFILVLKSMVEMFLLSNTQSLSLLKAALADFRRT